MDGLYLEAFSLRYSLLLSVSLPREQMKQHERLCLAFPLGIQSRPSDHHRCLSRAVVLGRNRSRWPGTASREGMRWGAGPVV